VTLRRRAFLEAVELVPGFDAALVFMRGEFDLEARRALDAEVRRLLAASPELLILDMSGVEFIDSTWLAVLMQLYRRVVRESGGVMRVAASPVAHRVLEISGLGALSRFELVGSPALL